jgi:osmotically inducible protein OsmC
VDPVIRIKKLVLFSIDPNNRQNQKEVLMPIRKGEAVWNGTLLKGNGEMKTGAGAIKAAYSFSSRFESGRGSNPEEFIGAAHAGCFSMALAGTLDKSGFSPEKIKTVARVAIEKDGDGFTITSIELVTEAQVPGIDNAAFQEKAEEAKAGCPVSKALAGVQIGLRAILLPL